MSTWKIDSSLEEWETVAGTIEDELADFGFSQKFIFSFMLALDEVFANISAYAYGTGHGEVIVRTMYETTDSERTAEATFTDCGKRFSPLENMVVPDTGESTAAKRKIGGLGIFLTKKQTDELKYSYMNGSNNLTLIKRETL